MHVVHCHVITQVMQIMKRYVSLLKTSIISIHVVPVNKDNKVEAYAQINDMMQGNDLLILARYMQILSEDFVAQWEMRRLSIFTIHSCLLSLVQSI